MAGRFCHDAEIWNGRVGPGTLGRWLKAEMLHRVFHDRPQVQSIRAGNADTNAAMLSINRALGFQRSVAWATWQVELEQVDKYLASGAG